MFSRAVRRPSAWRLATASGRLASSVNAWRAIASCRSGRSRPDRAPAAAADSAATFGCSCACSCACSCKFSCGCTCAWPAPSLTSNSPSPTRSPARDKQLGDPCGRFGAHFVLHLHRFEDQQGLAGGAQPGQWRRRPRRSCRPSARESSRVAWGRGLLAGDCISPDRLSSRLRHPEPPLGKPHHAPMKHSSFARSAASICALIGALAHGQAPAAAAIPPAANSPYPGTLILQVDASDLDRRIFRVKETIPVKPGPLTLLYPRWLPGNHAPNGRINAARRPEDRERRHADRVAP